MAPIGDTVLTSAESPLSPEGSEKLHASFHALDLNDNHNQLFQTEFFLKNLLLQPDTDLELTSQESTFPFSRFNWGQEEGSRSLLPDSNESGVSSINSRSVICQSALGDSQYTRIAKVLYARCNTCRVEGLSQNPHTTAAPSLMPTF